MTTQQLQALELLLVVLCTGLWLAAGVVTLSLGSPSGRGRGFAALGCAVAAVLLTLGRVAVVALLAGRGWWFAAEKALVSVPLAVLTGGLAAVVAIPLLRDAATTGADVERGRPMAAAALFTAAYGSAAGLLVAFVVGYPVAVVAAVVIVVLVIGLSGFTWFGLTGRRRPGLAAASAAACLVPVLIGAAVCVLFGYPARRHRRFGGRGTPTSRLARPIQLSVASGLASSRFR